MTTSSKNGSMHRPGTAHTMPGPAFGVDNPLVLGAPFLTDTKDAESPGHFGRRGCLEVRLAATPEEIDAAQALRYQVFYEEMSAHPDAHMAACRRDVDRFDTFCDHLLVIDHTLAKGSPEGKTPLEAVVGCYRLLRQDVAEKHGGFYTSREFDISAVIGRSPGLRFLELGRSCVLPDYRTRPTVELLWQGIMHYVARHDMDVMFGCASFESVDPDGLATPLSYLYHHHLTPDEWYVRALDGRFVEMNRLPGEQVDMRQALRALPPMIKGYIRAGCYIGDGAVIDTQFGTTDILVVFPVQQINARYFSKFARNG